MWGWILVFSLAAQALELPTVIHETLKASPQLARLKAELAIARLGEPRLLSNTDPEFFTRAQRTADKSPRIAPQYFGTRSDTDEASLGVRQKLLTGTQASLTFADKKTKTDSLFRAFDSYVESKLSLDFRQPLLKHLWGRPDKVLRSKERHRVNLLKAIYRRQAEDLINWAASAYWDCYAAQEALAIHEEGVLTASKFLASQKEKWELGLVEKSDLLQAEVSLALRETELRAAKTQVMIAISNLAYYYSAAAAPSFDETFKDHQPESLKGDSLEEIRRQAFDRRADWQAANIQARVARLDLDQARLEALPSFDLVSSLGYGGLSQSRRDSWQTLNDLNRPIYSFGFTFSLPFRRAKERLDVVQAEETLRAQEASQEELSQRIKLEVERTWQLYDLSEEKLKSAQRLLDLEREKYQEEEKNFQKGKSSTDILIRFQMDLLGAKIRYLESQIARAKAILNLELAQGSLAEKWAVENP